MDPVTIALLGMGGLSAISNLDKEGRQIKLASATQRYSPWTGNKAQPIDYANPVGDIAQGGASAMSYGQNQKMMDSQLALQKAQTDAISGGRGSISPNYGYRGNYASPNLWSNVYGAPTGSGY